MEMFIGTSGLVRTNSYFVTFPSGENYLIDAPDGNEEFIKTIRNQYDSLTAVLLTHGHFDHTTGLVKVLEAFPGTPVFLGMKDWYMMENDAEWNRDSIKDLGIPRFFMPKGFPTTFSPYLSMNGPFWVFNTPGHTMGSVSLYEPESQSLFSGDTLFRGGIGRTDLGGDENAIRSSLEILLDLPEETKVYPGHGPATTIALEKRNF